MSIRALLRIQALAVALLAASALLWADMGPTLALFALLFQGLTAAYLVLMAGHTAVSRWQLRYQLSEEEARDGLDRLEGILRFLAYRTGHLVVEANARGLLLELPQALDGYVEAQLPRALPELRLSKEEPRTSSAGRRGSLFLSLGVLSSEPLRWATEGEGRQVRLHIHQGPYVTLTAQTHGECPPGRWLHIPLPHVATRLWQRLPLWDELSAGVRLGSLFPPTADGAVYSSRSRLLALVPPVEYCADQGGRILGQAADGRPVAVSRDMPVYTVGAPAPFLAAQALDDLERGWTAVVLSPHRHILDRIAHEAAGTAAHWLDPQNAGRSAHLAVVSAAEWPDQDLETVIHTTQGFLADLGLDIDLPAVGSITGRLIRALALSAQQAGQALSFSDLYAVSQNTQALRDFLVEVGELAGDPARELLALLESDAGYVQAVTILSAIRAALKPLGSASLGALCQGPFLDAGQALREKGALLVPMANADFPEHDRLLGAMLDLTLQRVLATAGDELRLALHLHDAHRYRSDNGRRWVDAARRDRRLSLLLDVRDAKQYGTIPAGDDETQLIFHCPEALASSLVREWNLPASATELTELPGGMAIARLPGMVIALKTASTIIE